MLNLFIEEDIDVNEPLELLLESGLLGVFELELIETEVLVVGIFDTAGLTDIGLLGLVLVTVVEMEGVVKLVLVPLTLSTAGRGNDDDDDDDDDDEEVLLLLLDDIF